jgi:four helix bundle protein
MKIERFEDIESWKLARELTNQVYKITSTEKFKKDYGLKDQIQRASISIMANIAEGFDSGTNKSFANFLNYAYRSASEVQSLLYIALDQKYIQEKEHNVLYRKTSNLKDLIGGFIKYLRQNKKS